MIARVSIPGDAVRIRLDNTFGTINPHSWIHMDGKAPDGTVENWMVEGGTPNALVRRGFSKNSLLPGTIIVVDGFRSKDGKLKANGRDVTFPDGRKLFLGSSGTGAPEVARTPARSSHERLQSPARSVRPNRLA
jgi:hypothetical protein